MAAKLEPIYDKNGKRIHSGVYRRGSKYVVRYYANGRKHSEARSTLKAALELKRAREAARDRGEHDLVAEARITLEAYARDWIKRYQGNGRRGFTEHTRAEYVRDLERYVFAFPQLANKQLSAIRHRDVADFVAWLCDPIAQGNRKAMEKARKAAAEGKPQDRRTVSPVVLTDATVRRLLCPLRSCLGTARREGLIRSNPCDDVPLPVRPQIETGVDEGPKAMTREQLSMFLRVAPSRWRIFFRFLAMTGVRWSEVAAIQWGDLRLEGSETSVRVRRALVRDQSGDGPPEFKPPKSKYGVRTIPIGADLARELRQHHRETKFSASDDLVFCARNGSPLRQENHRRRVLRPAAEEAGVGWIGYHSFRHTFASLLFAEGRNIKQVQRLMGHHAPSFTLDTYTHLIDDGVGGGLDLDAHLAAANDDQGESKVSPPQADTGGSQRIEEPATSL